MEWSAKKGVHAHPDPQQRHQGHRDPNPPAPDSLCLPSREGSRGDKETEEDEEVDKEEETDDEEEREDNEDGDKEGTDERTEEWSAAMARAAEASEQAYAIGDERTTERRPKPPNRTGRDTRRAKSPDVGQTKTLRKNAPNTTIKPRSSREQDLRRNDTREKRQSRKLEEYGCQEAQRGEHGTPIRDAQANC